jgi:CubicO group peptidase (beta-lactamase class C family)
VAVAGVGAHGVALDAQDIVVRGEVGARADSFLTRAAAHGFSGAIVVAKGGAIVLRKGYGLADRERGSPITPETPFFVGSLAKQFTAAAVLGLEADGKLRLGDSLGLFFPNAPANKRSITIRQLLSHTAGLPYLPSAGLFGRGSRDSVMREMLSERLESKPGSRYEYSSPGYVLLAGVIERASGMTYEQYLRTLFERAKLRSTGFVGERERWSVQPVRSYSDGTAESLLADVPSLPRFVGAGSIVSTVGDVYQWYAALSTGRVLPDSQRAKLFDPVVRVRQNVQEGLTWLIVSIPTGTIRQAAGDIGGFNAELRDYVEEGLVIAFASNSRVRGRGYREIVLNAVARLSRGDHVTLPPEVVPIESSRLDSLVGRYAIADGGAVEVWTVGDSVFLGASNAGGIAALAGMDSAASVRGHEIDDKARNFLKSLDTDSAAAFFHPSIPADARLAYLDRIRAALRDSVAQRADVIGTAVDSPIDARTYVRLGSDIVSLVWNNGMLVGVAGGGRAAYTLRLKGSGANELSSYDLFTGRLVRVELLPDRELAIETLGVRRRASR